MSARVSTVNIPLYGLKGEPSWYIGSDDQPYWRIGEVDHPRAALALAAPFPDAPAAPFVPAAPAHLEPIGNMPVVTGRALPWDTFTEINSRSEGHFLERHSPGAYAKTLANRDRDTPVFALLNHGQDSSAGYKPLGRLAVWEASDGLRFSLAFVDAGYTRDVAAGAAAGLYFASVRFQTVRDRVVRRPAASPQNPLGIEERTIEAANLIEVSLTPRPAFGGTSVNLAAGMAA